jgi:hypothetical protein
MSGALPQMLEAAVESGYLKLGRASSFLQPG